MGASGLLDEGGVNASKKLIDFLSKHKCRDKIIFWVDSASRKWGKVHYEREVFAPKKIKEYPEALIIINTLSYMEVQKQ